MMAIAITWKYPNSTLANENESCNNFPANLSDKADVAESALRELRAWRSWRLPWRQGRAIADLD